jgi:ribonuclease HI
MPAMSSNEPASPARPAAPKRVVVHTDGGCHGNPGPGGWAAVLRYGRQELEVGGGDPDTTNNRMELSAAIGALSALNQSCQVELHTDSQYLRKGITEWIHGWKRKGWRTAEGEPVKNEDLWRRLDELVARHTVEWRWVKGHAGNELNERCDRRASAEIAKVKSRRQSS